MNKQKQIELRTFIQTRDKGICQRCNKLIGFKGAPAHRIAQSKVNRKKYGNEIIDHPYNIVWACVNNDCNDSFNIGNKPEKIKQLIWLIENCGNENLSAKKITDYIWVYIEV